MTDQIPISEAKVMLADDTIDDKTKRAIARELRSRESSPTSRHFSESYKFFQQQLGEAGTPHDVTRIPISVLKQMERDPIIAFGLHFIRTPLLRSRWYIEAEDARVAAFIDKALRRIYPTLLKQYGGAWNYGFKPIVKRFQFENPQWTYLDPVKSDDPLQVWDNGRIQAITWKTFIGLPSDPAIVEPNFNARGEFDGISYNGGRLPLPFRFPLTPDDSGDEGVKDVPLRHSLWFTNEKESANESLWGFPRTGYAFRPWWSSWFRWALYDRFFERKADPPYVVYYPVGDEGDYVEMDDETISTNKAIALGLAEAARSGGGIAMPGKTITGYDDRPTTIREWEIAELEVRGDMSHFVESFEYLDVMKLRALFIPEQAVWEGKGGTSSRNVAKEEIGLYKEGVANEADTIDEHINKYVIPDLVFANFPNYKGECRKVTTGFHDADQKTLETVLQLIGQGDPGELTRQIDMRETLDRLGLPLLSLEVLRDREKKVQKEIDNLPPPVLPEAGGNAGVNEEGFYVQAPQIITLADDSSFISKLPQTKHYTDKKILSSARQIRSRWKQGYKDIYEDFAQFVAKQDINLDEADDKAEDIINKWEYSRRKLSALMADTQSIVKRVMSRAGQVELARAEIPGDFRADNDAIAEYLEDRGAIYVKIVDETIKAELRSFLSNAIREGVTQDQLANLVREHFEDFSEWKADRLVRSEIRDAYNFAQLAAGFENGIRVVLARDAQLGDTDPECENRNGRFFTTGQALSETLKEHPNGTLEWEFTKLDAIPNIVENSEIEDNQLAYYDEKFNTINFSPEVGKEERSKFILALGEAFKR